MISCVGGMLRSREKVGTDLVEEHAVEAGPFDRLVEVGVVESRENRHQIDHQEGLLRWKEAASDTYTMAGLFPPSSRVTDSAGDTDGGRRGW